MDNLGVFNPDIYLEIIQYCHDINTIINLILVSKQINTLCLNKKVWTKVFECKQLEIPIVHDHKYYIHQYKRASYATFTANKLVNYITSTEIMDNRNTGAYIYINEYQLPIHISKLIFNLLPPEFNRLTCYYKQDQKRVLIFRVTDHPSICFDLCDTFKKYHHNYQCDMNTIIHILTKIIYYDPYVLIENVNRKSWLPDFYAYDKIFLKQPSLYNNILYMFSNNYWRYWSNSMEEYIQQYFH